MSRRSFRVTLSAWLVLFFTAWNAVRLWTALAWWDVLVELSAKPAPILTAISAVFWFIVGLSLFWGMLWGRAWAGKVLMLSAPGYSAWYWFERLFWQEPRPNWPFAVILNLVILILVFFTARSLTHSARS